MRVAGIDPGTGSMDILAFDDETGRILLDTAIPRSEVTRDPAIVVRVLEKLHREVRLDAVVAPSGYGIPLKPARNASGKEIILATFINCEDEARNLQIVGLRRLMFLLRESELPAWFTPGAIQLPTIPDYRKSNKIDMGTADKVYTVAAALAAEREKYGVEPSNSRLIVIEAGKAYTSAMLVWNGEIVDAIAGTAGFWGFMGGGCMDAETAYALASAIPRFSKTFLFRGGAADVLGKANIERLEHGLEKGEPKALEAARMLGEGMEKAVLALYASAPEPPNRIYVSGRLFRTRILSTILRKRLQKIARILSIEGGVSAVPRVGSETKEAATGAAIIASGISGGSYEWIVHSLQLHESKGTPFDWIRDEKIRSKLLEMFGKPCQR